MQARAPVVDSTLAVEDLDDVFTIPQVTDEWGGIDTGPETSMVEAVEADDESESGGMDGEDGLTEGVTSMEEDMFDLLSELAADAEPPVDKRTRNDDGDTM